MKVDRNVRLSQTLAPFGVGAIYDFVGESIVACDTSWWKGRGTPLRLKRLEDQLGVTGFRSAPSHATLFSSKNTPRVPYYRFPTWMFCARCRVMRQNRPGDERENEPPVCHNTACTGRPRMVPMRFVMVCEDGHLSDAPWQFWAHIGAESPEQKQCKSRNLMFLSRKGVGAGLASLQIRCNTCKASNHLGKLSAKDSLSPYRIRCDGRQPWEKFESARPCDAPPQVLQRGASNVYFSRISSAIDIPPESDYSDFDEATLTITNSHEFGVIVGKPDGPMVPLLIDSLIDEYGVTEAQVRKAMKEHMARVEGRTRTSQSFDTGDLATDEWNAFQVDQDETDDRDRFITRPVEFLADSQLTPLLETLNAQVERVVVATRLREVRALQSFSRLSPDGKQLSPHLEHDNITWLPAIEVFGEGVFLSLAEAAVSNWEINPQVVERAASLDERREHSLFGARLAPASPRFLLLHTLAHLLIRQLAFDCGYAASSLRERIYAKTSDEGDPQAGILLYTAAGDVEGTLGGLVRQGEPPRLARTMLRALQSAAWCSADPLCRESSGQGFQSLNLGACHACSLVSETSCASFNLLLDRVMVVGSDGLPGFFQPTLEAATREAAVASGDA